jgi:hypothetical protein
MEQLKAFWFIVVDVRKEGLWAVDLGRLYIWLHLESGHGDQVH